MLLASLVMAIVNGPARGAEAAEDAADAAGSAKAHYKLARTHYQLGEYRDALTEFKEAYRLKQDASFLYNMAQCLRQLGDYAEAIKLYGSYLREAPSAPNRAEVERFVREMKDALDKREKQEAASAATAVATPAATVAGVSPVPSPAAPDAGSTPVAPTAAPSPTALAPVPAPVVPAPAREPAQPVQAELQIASEPSEAKFFVNHMAVGAVSPVKLRLPPGLYAVSIERDGFRGAEGAVALIAGERSAVTGKLLRVKTHGWRGLGHVFVALAVLSEGSGIAGHILANRSFQGTDHFNKFSTMEKIGQGVAISSAVLAAGCYVADWLVNRKNFDPGPPGLLAPIAPEAQ